jgi:hypothetical protein
MLLLSSSTRPSVVAGKSDMVTSATIQRAIEDAGSALPKNGLLVIVGNPKKFEETVNFAKNRGLNVDVMSPMEKDGSPPLSNPPVVVAPSTEPSIKSQNQVQKDSNVQINQLLQGSGTRR